MKSSTKRPPREQKVYHQTERALSTEATRRRLVESAVHLICTAPRVNAITLNEIADEAGVALRTLLRHYKSREGLFETAFAHICESMSSHRNVVAAGDIDGAIDALTAHYERDGELNIKALNEEHELPILHKALTIGRKFHTQWLETCFEPHLPRRGTAAYDAALLSLYAATDVYLWKLIRHDLRHSKKVYVETVTCLVRGCLRGSTTEKKGKAK